MNKYILLAITALCLQDMQAQTVVHPSIKTKTTFAIVVDQKSYDEAKSEIDAYRTSIEKEGLGTYLLIDDWKRPEPIREQLVKLHENKRFFYSFHLKKRVFIFTYSFTQTFAL